VRAVALNIKGPSLCIQDGPRENTSAAACGSLPHCTSSCDKNAHSQMVKRKGNAKTAHIFRLRVSRWLLSDVQASRRLTAHPHREGVMLSSLQ
jgi:hypothetical protein